MPERHYTGSLVASLITPHTPRMAIEERAPDFVKDLIAGLKSLGDFLRNDLKPDLLVTTSTHWVSSFNWYVTTHAVHEGYCVADEAPDLIPGLFYRYQGDPEFAEELITAISDDDLPCFANDTPYFTWDYAHYIPLKYIDPKSEIPVVLIPTCLAADFDECRTIGQKIVETAEKLGRNIVFLSSTALSHEIVRGPEKWPTEERQALDMEFLDLLEAGEIEKSIDWLPEYSKRTVAEMGGRPLAMFLGTLEKLKKCSVLSRHFGEYTQSSGSGNISVCLWPE